MKPSIRSCLVCRGRAEKAQLVRLVYKDGEGLLVDLKQRSGGRGAYIHPQLACILGLGKAKNLRSALRLGQAAKLSNEQFVKVHEVLQKNYTL